MTNKFRFKKDRKSPKRGHFNHFGGTKNGALGFRIKILRPLFNTNQPSKLQEGTFRNQTRPQKVIFGHFEFLIFLPHFPLSAGHFLAVQNSSIGDLVTHSLTFTFAIQRAIQETCNHWDIWSEWWQNNFSSVKCQVTRFSENLKTFQKSVIKIVIKYCRQKLLR